MENTKKKKVRIRFKNKKAAVTAIVLALAVLPPTFVTVQVTVYVPAAKLLVFV